MGYPHIKTQYCYPSCSLQGPYWVRSHDRAKATPSGNCITVRRRMCQKCRNVQWGDSYGSFVHKMNNSFFKSEYSVIILYGNRIVEFCLNIFHSLWIYQPYWYTLWQFDCGFLLQNLPQSMDISTILIIVCGCRNSIWI